MIPLFAFPADIRKVIYTTNATRSLNMTLRKVTHNHRIFPSDEAVYKVLYLAMRNIEKPVDDADPRLEASAGSLCRGMCGAVPEMTKKATYTILALAHFTCSAIGLIHQEINAERH